MCEIEVVTLMKETEADHTSHNIKTNLCCITYVNGKRPQYLDAATTFGFLGTAKIES